MVSYRLADVVLHAPCSTFDSLVLRFMPGFAGSSKIEGADILCTILERCDRVTSARLQQLGRTNWQATAFLDARSGLV